MARINDIPFSDIYITPDKTAFINDRKTENGLAVLRADDFERFYEQLVQAWDGSNPSYSLLYDNIFYRVERTVALYGVQYCARKMPEKVPEFTSLGFPNELTRMLLSLSGACINNFSKFTEKTLSACSLAFSVNS